MSDPGATVTPRCSIIIPLFNQVAYTRACIAALVEHTDLAQVELVLVDNGSSDDTGSYLDELEAGTHGVAPERLQVIRNPENRGFAAACNQGAAAAHGAHVVFVNNDTEAHPGWLEPLLGVLDREPDVGAVGAKLLFPDGTVQHAGVWLVRDERTRPLVAIHAYYGHASDDARVNERADVQVVTAAVVALRRDAFEAVGGFDEGYWNGYEDVDLCLALRDAGWRVVYEPASELTHHESKSGAERFSRVPENERRLLERWAERVTPDLVINTDGEVRRSEAADPVATTPDAAPPTIVLNVFGPTSVTRAAIRRARELAGPDGRLICVPANRLSAPLLDRVPARTAEVTRGIGSEGLREAFLSVGDAPALLLHDDVYLDRSGFEAMHAAFDGSARYVVPYTNDTGTDHFVGALPPVASARSRLRREAAGLATPGGHATTLRPACLLARGSDLRALLGRNLQSAVTFLELKHDRPRIAAGAVAAHDCSCFDQLHAPEGPDGRPLLVAALIVRDEEEMLAECLASLDGVVDRIEVCDTGSVDRTVEIAEAHGATVIHREWRDDFAWARNEVLERCRDAWFVLQIDADERLEVKDVTHLRRFLATNAGEPVACQLDVHNVGRDGSRVRSTALRLFPAAGTAYRGRIHERPYSLDAAAPLRIMAAEDISLVHLGYDDEITSARNKGVRNVTIAESAYAEDPSPENALHLARSLTLTDADPQRRAALFEQALEGADLNDAARAAATASLADLLAELGEPERALSLAEEAVALAPTDAHASKVHARVARIAGRPERAIELAEQVAGSDAARAYFEADVDVLKRGAELVRARVAAGDVQTALDELLALLRRSGAAFDAWHELVPAVATRPDASDRLLELALLDTGGGIWSALRAAWTPDRVAALATTYVRAGGQRPEPVQLGLAHAVVTRDVAAIEALAEAAERLPRPIVVHLADRADRAGLAEAATRLRGEPVDVTRTVAKVVTVVGMHRSGTSAVANLLSELGISFGDPEQLIPAAADNPRGFYENRLVADHNERLLAALGGTWHAPPSLPDGWWRDPALAGFREDAARIWQALAAEADVVAWKAPRGCLLAPYWDAIIQSQTNEQRAVHVVRAPDEVAASLARRDGLDAEHAARLWVTYVTDALRNTPDALIVHQHELVTDLPGVVRRLVGGLGLDIEIELAVEQAAKAVEPTLFNQRGQRVPDGPWVDLARTLHARLEAGDDPAAVAEAGRAGSTRLLDGLDGTAPASLLVAVETLDESVPTALAASGRSLALGERRPTLACGSADPVRRYAWQAAGWAVETLPADVAVRRFRPLAAFAPAFGPETALVAGIVQHEPGVRLVADQDGDLARLADAVVDLRADGLGDTLAAAVAEGRVEDVATPAPGIVPPAETVTGLVSIVIPVMNNWALTRACLDRLAVTCEDARVEVVVVDNGSTDETPAALASRPDVDRVITNATNLGFARAVNQGIAAARGELVCVLNNDTEPVDGWLTTMRAALEVPGTGLVGPRSNHISGPQQITAAPKLAGDHELVHAWAARWRASRPDASWTTDRLVGFCVLAPRDLFVELGGFDEGVLLGNFEDDELCARIRRAGMTLRVAERAVVLHHGGATFLSEGIDHRATMLAGGRRVRPHLAAPSDVIAIVLSDGQSEAAVATAGSALQVVDRVEIWERGDLAGTERAAAVLPAAVTVRTVDWHDDASAAAAAEEANARRLVVLGAGERPRVSDRVRARLELGAVSSVAGLGHVSGGGEIRVVTPESIGQVGGPAVDALAELALA